MLLSLSGLVDEETGDRVKSRLALLGVVSMAVAGPLGPVLGKPLRADPVDLHNSALIRPPEELLHSKCSTLRGELDSSTPRVSGVLRMAVFEG